MVIITKVINFHMKNKCSLNLRHGRKNEVTRHLSCQNRVLRHWLCQAPRWSRRQYGFTYKVSQDQHEQLHILDTWFPLNDFILSQGQDRKKKKL